MRSIWTGALTFGLVNIPVKMYSGAQTDNLDLDMLVLLKKSIQQSRKKAA